MHDKIID